MRAEAMLGNCASTTMKIERSHGQVSPCKRGYGASNHTGIRDDAPIAAAAIDDTRMRQALARSLGCMRRLPRCAERALRALSDGRRNEVMDSMLARVGWFP